jgi:hypothetical protein
MRLEGRSRTVGLLAVVAIFAVMILILLSPSLLGGKILSSGDVVFFQGPFNGERPSTLLRSGNFEQNDPVLVFQPDLIVIRRALKDGQLGLWNPYQAAGRPLLASQQTAPLFPLTWLALIGSFWRKLAWIAALKLLAAALGAYALGRWTGLGRGPAVLVGTCYAFSTYLNDGLQFPLSGVMAVLPWTMLMAGRVGRRGTLSDTLGFALALGLLMLTGSPELIAIALGGLLFYAAFELFRHGENSERAPPASKSRRLSLLLVGGVAGFALSAVALAPFVEFLGLANTTSRGGVGGYPNSIAYSFFFPELWGRPDKAIGQFGPINYTERTAYLGALSLLLAVGGLFARRPRGEHLFWALFALAAVLIAMNTFLHNFVAELPGPDHVDMLRTLELVELSGALLAGLGFQAWLQADAAGRRRMMGAMVVAGFVPVAFLLRHINPFSHLGGALGQLPSLGREAVSEKGFIKEIVAWRWIIFGGLGLVVLALFPRLSRRVVVGLVIALAAADLLTIDAGYNPQVPLAQASAPAPPALGYVRAHLGHQRISGILEITPGGNSVDLQANLAERYALPDIGSYNFPKTSRWANLWGAYGQSTGDQNDWSPLLPKARQLLDAFAARYVLPPAGTRGPLWLKPVYDQVQGQQLVLENPTALPRAWVAYDWRSVASQASATAATVASSTRQLRREPVLEGAPPAPSPASGSPPNASAVSFLLDQNEYVRLRADVTHRGYLVLDDAYYPGWQVAVDGRPAKIVAANENFRAVPVAPGLHTIDFRYRPGSFRVGAILSILTAAGLLAVGLVLLLRRRSQSRSSA